MSHQPRFYATPNFLKMGIKYLNLLSFIQVLTKRTEVCCKVSLYKNCQRQRCSAINCLLSGINTLAGGRPLPPEILVEADPSPPEGSKF